MKKKTSILLLSGALCLSLAACSGGGTTATEPPSHASPDHTVSTPAPTPSTIAPTPSPEVNPYEITYQKANVYTNSIGTTWVQTIVEITNTGSDDLYLSTGSYDLEDESGALVASQKYVSVFPSVIAPGEKGYMYEETTLDDDPGVSELTVVPHESVETAKVECIRYPVSDLQLTENKYGGVKIIGRVENDSSEAEGMIYIAVAMYDANDTPIGVMFTILQEELAAGDKIGFEVKGFSLPDSVTADSVANYTVFAYPMQMQF